MMKPATLIRGAMLAVAAACSIALCACEETTEDKLEKAGETTSGKLEDAGKKAGDAVKDAKDGAEKGLKKLGEAFD